MSRIDETMQAKLEKRRALEEKGVIVHPYTFDKKNTVVECRESLGQTVQTAGRILSLRTHGKLNFLDLQDDTGKIQVMVRENELPEDQRELLSLIDAGDYLGVAGVVDTSKTGEVSIMANSIQVLGKALRPIPTSWNAAEDKEVRFRKRYLDMMVNPRTKQVLDARWLIEKELRRYLQDVHGFTEVETPVFQPLYGGTNAKPFSTHMNALDSDFYLRLAPELYLKRLIVGGYEKIFEIARNFRNEGIDQTHQPEFTMIEWYEAYADYQRMMDVTEGLFKHLAEKLHGNTSIQMDDHTIDLRGVWPRITMKAAIQQYFNLDFDAQSDADLLALLSKEQLELAGEFTRGKAQFAIFDKLVAKQLINPTWIIDYPRDISPLAKQHRAHPELAERFELYVGGKELADGWSEITDALDQRRLFENEQKRMRQGDSEAHPLDEDFLEAMEYGMPPLGGIGIGIDRLVMFLTNTWSIREVIAFPTLRPLHKLTVGSETPRAAVAINANQVGLDPQVTARFPGMFYAFVIIKDVKITKRSDQLEEEKSRILAAKSKLTVEEIEALKPIAEYRALYRATGVDLGKRRPSPEALLRRITAEKGIYTINTAVDAYNLAVVETGVALGGFDASQLVQPVTLRFAQEGESVWLLGDDAETTTQEGELVYADQEKILTLDLNYRDNSATKLTEKTTDILLYADGAPGLSTTEVVDALVKGAENIIRYSGGSYTLPTVVGRDYSGASLGQSDSTPLQNNTDTQSSPSNVPSRQQSEQLMHEHIKNEALRHHVEMVARAMEAYAAALGEDAELWYAAGLLHDLDWEEYPDEHPNKAIADLLGDYPQALKDAIASHAPERTGREPMTTLDKYLFACDELSGLMHAYSLMRPTGFDGMEVKSVKKKLKDKAFAANVSRGDIERGMDVIGKTPEEHIAFLIAVFATQPA